MMLVLITLSSCITQRKCFNKFPPPPPSIEKVVETVTVFKDTTVYVSIPADTIYQTDTVFINKDGLVNYPLARIDVEYAWSTIQIKNNRVFHYLYQKETEIAKTIQDAIKESTTSEVTVIREPYEVPMPVSWWNQTMIKGGYVLLGIIILLFGFLFLKKFTIPISFLKNFK